MDSLAVQQSAAIWHPSPEAEGMLADFGLYHQRPASTLIRDTGPRIFTAPRGPLRNDMSDVTASASEDASLDDLLPALLHPPAPWHLHDAADIDQPDAGQGDGLSTLAELAMHDSPTYTSTSFLSIHKDLTPSSRIALTPFDSMIYITTSDIL